MAEKCSQATSPKIALLKSRDAGICRHPAFSISFLCLFIVLLSPVFHPFGIFGIYKMRHSVMALCRIGGFKDQAFMPLLSASVFTGLAWAAFLITFSDFSAFSDLSAWSAGSFTDSVRTTFKSALPAGSSSFSSLSALSAFSVFFSVLALSASSAFSSASAFSAFSFSMALSAFSAFSFVSA